MIFGFNIVRVVRELYPNDTSLDHGLEGMVYVPCSFSPQISRILFSWLGLHLLSRTLVGKLVLPQSTKFQA